MRSSRQKAFIMAAFASDGISERKQGRAVLVERLKRILSPVI